MSNKFSYIAMFIFGATIGSAVTWQYAKKKHEQLIQEEIDSVKAAFSKKPIPATKEESDEASKQAAEEAKAKPNISEYASKIHEQGYTNYSKEVHTKEKKESEIIVTDRPYIISPDDFAEFEDYETISLTYYADKVLTDDNDELVEEIDEVVGLDSLTSFGEYEDDSVFVRNDQLKCDYEILLDHRQYSDVSKEKPHEVSD